MCESERVVVTPWDREVAAAAKGTAQIFRGDIKEGASILWEIRQRLEANEFHFTKTIVDGPLGVAMVLRGDISQGMRFMQQAIQRNLREGGVISTDLARIYVAETYIEILRGNQTPPLKVILRNLLFLIYTSLTGWQTAVEMLQLARKNKIWSGHSYYRARIDADLGFLYMLRKKRHPSARHHLEEARIVARQRNATTLLTKIDAALAELG